MWCFYGEKSIAEYLKAIVSNNIKPSFGAPSVIVSYLICFGQRIRNDSHIILHECENTVAESDGIAEICNVYFSNISAEILLKDEHATPAWGDTMQSFNFQTVNHDCISRKLQMININKATEYDNIQAKLLRLAQNELTHPIANLINTTMAMSARAAMSRVPYSKKKTTPMKWIFDPSVFWPATQSFMNLLWTINF